MTSGRFAALPVDALSSKSSHSSSFRFANAVDAAPLVVVVIDDDVMFVDAVFVLAFDDVVVARDASAVN